MADWPYCWPWPKVRAVILERDHNVCTISECGKPASDVDHIVPPNEGGAPYDPDNLRAACAKHNRGRGQARLAAMAKLNRQPAVTASREW